MPSIDNLCQMYAQSGARPRLKVDSVKQGGPKIDGPG